MKLAVALLVASASATVYFKESFGDDWESRWTKSAWKDAKEIGEWKHTAGKYHSDAADKGIQTGQDARFYGISAKMDSVFNNKGKTLVLQYSVKHDQDIDCGGAYLKLLESGLDQSKFGGDSEYKIMFGPDVCGHTKRTHAILSYDGKSKDNKLENFLHKSDIKTETDSGIAHLYTMILNADNTYEVQIDGKKVQDGKIADNWDMLHPKKIKDPKESKPKDWVDEKKIPDPEDKKPEGYDDIPKQIPDPEASKPDDWDDEDDGEWEAPMIDNPKFKGEWKAKQIDNPKYKGEWVHPEIDNPDFKDDTELYARCEKCEYVGFELWQVKSGTIFDDIIVTDSIEEAKKFADETFYAKQAGEKKMKDEADAKAKKEAEEKAAKAAEEKKKKEAEEKAKKEAEEDAKEDDEDDEDDDKKKKDEL